ncbi:MAG: hypothetical protein ACRC0S_02195 [Fusobacteriaceae bacterium]
MFDVNKLDLYKVVLDDGLCISYDLSKYELLAFYKESDKYKLVCFTKVYLFDSEEAIVTEEKDWKTFKQKVVDFFSKLGGAK